MTLPKNDFAFLHRWERDRKENKWRFAFRVGVIQYALPIIALLSLYDVIMGVEQLDFYLKIRVFYALPIYIACGVLAGRVMWNNNEKRYRGLKGLD